MHGEIDSAGKQCFFDLLGEQPLAAGLGEWPVLDRIAGGADDLDFDVSGIEAAGGGEPALHLARLHQRKRRTARSDAQDRRFCR